jgi:WD40 repeat protein
VGPIRALDIQSIPDKGQIIAATSGGDDRADRRISLWDVRSGRLLAQLDNGTHKPVLALAFHPQKPNLLLAADMEFDVKLWDWEQGKVVRMWKKHHTRVIWKIGFIPGRDGK